MNTRNYNYTYYGYKLYGFLLTQRGKSIKLQERFYSNYEVNFCWTKYITLKKVKEEFIVKFGGLGTLELIHSNSLILELSKPRFRDLLQKYLFQNNSVSSK